MQTKIQSVLSATAFARRAADAPVLAAPVELSAEELQLVGGGLAPRGGWAATSDTVMSTTESAVQAPRGGW
jgi:hypothetical protein